MPRQTEYRPEMCEEAITFLAEGYSLAALGGQFGVSRQTIYNWKNDHPDFAEALAIGQAKAVLWWEQANRGLAMGADGNATSIVFGLKNRAPEDWKDMKALEHTGADGGPVQISEVRRTIVDPKAS